MQHRPRAPLLGLVAAILVMVAFACGDSDAGLSDAPDREVGATVDPDNPPPTRDPSARELERELRAADRAVRGLEGRIDRLSDRIDRWVSEQTEESEIWFEECCDGAHEDVEDSLSDANAAFTDLAASYEEAGDDERLQIAKRLEIHTANIEAWLAVLSALPASAGAATIIDDMLRDVAALREAVAALQ